MYTSSIPSDAIIVEDCVEVYDSVVYPRRVLLCRDLLER